MKKPSSGYVRKLKADITDLEHDVKKATEERDRARVIYRAAVRDFLHSQDVLAGLAHVAKAAEYFIATGHAGAAQVLLSVCGSVHVDEMRKRVADEMAPDSKGTDK